MTSTSNPSTPPSDQPSREPRSGWLTRNVLALGAVSFFTDVSSEMIVPLLPVFIATIGGGALALGLVEGLADAIASVLKLVAGRWTDRTGKRLPFVLGGYGLSSIARPLIGLATSAWHVVLVRCIDRVGKGLRSSPRDALIAHSVPAGGRGAAFGFHRAMDHAGATVGPLIAIVLLFAGMELRSIFLLAAAPALVSVIVAWRGVREVPAPLEERAIPPAGKPREPMLGFLLALGLFTLGKASDLFLLQLLLDRPSPPEARSSREDLVASLLVWIGLHVLKSLASLPGGRLSDRHGRRRVIVTGWLLHAVACTGLAFAHSYPALLFWFSVWALQDGFTEGSQKALVSDLAPRRAQGAAFGWYHLTLGFLALAASVLFGALYQTSGRSTAFLVSAAIAVLATAGFVASHRSAGRTEPERS